MEKPAVAAAKFFVRIGQTGRATEQRDTYTRPLFSLALILDADGTLADDAKHLVGPKPAEVRKWRDQ